MNTNSLITYKELLADGTITRKEKEVLEFIRTNSITTGNYIDVYINGGHKRLASLERKGLIKVVDVRRDEITHKPCSVYVLNTVPQIVKEPKPTKPTYAQLEKELAKYPQKMAALYDMAFKKGVEFAMCEFFGNTDMESMDKLVRAMMEKVYEP